MEARAVLSRAVDGWQSLALDLNNTTLSTWRVVARRLRAYGQHRYYAKGSLTLRGSL